MENHSENIITESLLAKYFNNEASEMEISQINSWRSLSKKNEIEFQELQLVWLDTGIIFPNHKLDELSIDVEDAWTTFSGRIQEKSISTSRQINWGFYTKIAAAVLLALGAFWIFQLTNQEMPQQELVASNTIISHVLNDSSEVVLNKNAKLTFPDEFSSTERRVKLSGEAHFQIKPNKEKPFLIEVDQALVKVLGTSFIVKESSENSTIKVMVETGKVLFSYQEKSLILTKGMSATLDQRTGILLKDSEPTVNIGAWKSNKLIFKRTTLSEVIYALNDLYHQNVILENEAMGNCTLTATFDNEEFEAVLEIIQSTFDFEIQETGETIIIKGDGC